MVRADPIITIDEEAAVLRKEALGLRARLDEIEGELSKFAQAREVLLRLGFEESKAVEAAPVSDHHITPERPMPSMPTNTTTRRWMEFVLRSATRLWLTANDLRDVVSSQAGRDIPMSTISPYLSEMKRDGLIVRDGMRVALKERVTAEQPSFFQENGEAEASPDPDQSGSSDQNSQPRA